MAPVLSHILEYAPFGQKPSRLASDAPSALRTIGTGHTVGVVAMAPVLSHILEYAPFGQKPSRLASDAPSALRTIGTGHAIGVVAMAPVLSRVIAGLTRNLVLSVQGLKYVDGVRCPMLNGGCQTGGLG